MAKRLRDLTLYICPLEVVCLPNLPVLIEVRRADRPQKCLQGRLPTPISCILPLLPVTGNKSDSINFPTETQCIHKENAPWLRTLPAR